MEVWKTIEDYPDYQVSNLGRVKSLKFGKEKILNGGKDSSGYLFVILRNDLNRKTINIHKLVAIYFLNHKPCGHNLVINHKDFNKLNNNFKNLEIITHRENSNMKHLKSSSRYTGVCWDKSKNKWMSQIYINKKVKYLGHFETEIEASETYQKELLTLNN
jgi:hypothetical protein